MERPIEEVLVEYDGPQLATRRGNDGSWWLSAAVADTTAGDVLWVDAPLSDQQWDDMINGTASLHDLLRVQAAVYVIRNQLDDEVFVYQRIGVPADDDLPRPGVLLPTLTRDFLLARKAGLTQK